MDSRRNNFDALRLLFAAMVIFSHSFALAGQAEPVIWNRTLGNLGVHGFFIISGFLIAQSYQRSGSLFKYGTNRFLRIVPGLVVALIVSSLIAARLHNFVHNPVPYISNGPVWTLAWEVICYAAIAVLGIVGALSRTTFPAVFAVAWVLYLANIGNGSDFFLAIVPLFLMFAAGALFALYLTEIRIELLVLALIGLALTAHFGVFTYVDQLVVGHIPFLYGPVVTPEEVLRVIYIASFPVVVIWVGKLARPSVRITNDVSYGAYIYGWPVAQVLVFFALKWSIPLNPYLVFVTTMIITLPLAFVSWRLIEKPALSLKRRFQKVSTTKEPEAEPELSEPLAVDGLTVA
ncbi:acyltransferase family protein [Diaminobutyricibacter sp. McL0618]|uniref:acyltransferase family protein n=1 Tax=Leifsonia sp. McL0618 TaxID=3415677 RepID=UPI003CF7D23B